MICRIFKRPSGLQKEHDCIGEVRHGVGHALDGPKSTRWGLCGLGVGAGMALVKCVFFGMEDDAEGEREGACFSVALLERGHVRSYSTQRWNLQTPTGAFE